jgi:hypothetical protein
MYFTSLIEKVATWLTPERIRLYPFTICVFTFLAWGISIAMGRGLTDAFGNVIGGDFLNFYTAGNFFLNGGMTELYDINAQAAFQERLLAPITFKSLSQKIGDCPLFSLGANLIGALVGALLQSITFLTGIKALLLIITGLYFLAMLFDPRRLVTRGFKLSERSS